MSRYIDADKLIELANNTKDKTEYKSVMGLI